MSESLDIGAKLPRPDLVWLDSAPVRLLSAALNHYMFSHRRQQDKVALVPATRGPGEIKLSWPDLAGLTWIGTSTNTTEHDDAVAPVELWDSRVLTVHHNPEALLQFQDLRGYTALDCLRQFLLWAWRRNVCKSLCFYLQGMECTALAGSLSLRHLEIRRLIETACGGRLRRLGGNGGLAPPFSSGAGPRRLGFWYGTDTHHGSGHLPLTTPGPSN
jgi:hypothetical protein